jgi:DNA-binding NarL/FixJ family response regulator
MSATSIPTTPVSVIIADDHPSIRYGIRSILEDVKFISRIEEADSGEAVLALLSSNPFDVILMDIAMPRGDGLSTTGIIADTYPSTRVIALSMHKDERYVFEMFNKGAMGYLLKNSDREDIIEAICEVIAGNKYVSKEISQTMIEMLSSFDINSVRNAQHSGDLREIIYLMCFEKTSKEIADIKCLSTRTVEKYRQSINKLTGSKNVAGVIRYAIDEGIYNDIILKNKFESYLNNKK